MPYSTRMLSSLPFGNIIGGPLKAAIEAQGMAAHATVDFIQTVGFNPKPRPKNPLIARLDFNPVATDATPDMGSVRNVTFSYTSANEEGEDVTVELTVPLLTIIPIPFLRIEEMTINFTAKITEEMSYSYDYEEAETTEDSTERENKYPRTKRRDYTSNASFKGTVTTNNKTTTKNNSRYQTECAMEINVKATQDDMPGGLSRILNILESAILEKRTPVPQTPPDDN
jgi:hypothetical protein